MSEVSGFLSFGIIVNFSIFSSKPGPKKSEMPSQIFQTIKRKKSMVFSNKDPSVITPLLLHMPSNLRLKQNGKHGKIKKELHKKMPKLHILNWSKVFSENESHFWLQDIYMHAHIFISLKLNITLLI